MIVTQISMNAKHKGKLYALCVAPSNISDFKWSYDLYYQGGIKGWYSDTRPTPAYFKRCINLHLAGKEINS